MQFGDKKVDVNDEIIGKLNHLYDVLWEKADGTLSDMKYHYYNFLSDRFEQSYSKTLGDWCKENNIRCEMDE